MSQFLGHMDHGSGASNVGHAAPYRFLVALNQVSFGSSDPTEALDGMLKTLREWLDCDRAWLLYPCDPGAKAWSIPVESTAQDFPGAHQLGATLPMTPAIIELTTLCLTAPKVFTYDDSSGRQVQESLQTAFSIKSQMAMTLAPRIGGPWLVGVHQCRDKRIWSESDVEALSRLGERIRDNIDLLLLQQRLEDSETKLAAVFENLDDAHLECDLGGTIKQASRSLRDHLGYESSDVIGTQVGSYFCFQLEHSVAWARMTEDPNPSPMEVNLIAADGTKTLCLLTGRQHLHGFKFSLRALSVNEADNALAEEAPSTIPRPTLEVGKPKSIAIVSPENKLVELLAPWLEQEQIKITVFRQVQKLSEFANQHTVDVIVLDKLRLGQEFLSACSNLHRDFPHTPLIAVGVEEAAKERIAALYAGVDDVLQRPVHPDELVARILAAWRRSQLSNPSQFKAPGYLLRGRLQLDPGSHAVIVDNKPVEFTTTEFSILLTLVRLPGRVCTRDLILNSIWGEDSYGSPRTVDSHIRNLRTKLREVAKDYSPIRSVRGLGYKFEL